MLVCIFHIALQTVVGQKVQQAQSELPKTILYQAVDSSFIELWMNWWVVAIGLRAVPSHWDVHIACFGDDINDVMKLFYPPGCSEVISGYGHTKRIYYYKWLAATRAFRKGYNMIIIDLDALLIRDPTQFIQDRKDYDVLASRDHGPGNLPNADYWALGRICTGFIHFQYNAKTLGLVEHVLKRADKFGHDQIQFNKAVVNAALVWKDSPERMGEERIRHDGYMAWMQQNNPDFTLFSESEVDSFRGNWTVRRDAVDELLARTPSSKQEVGGRTINAVSGMGNIPQKMTLQMMGKYDVLRYCNKPQAKTHDWIPKLELADIPATYSNQILALHCFVNAGPLKEQGRDKKKLKINVFEALGLWTVNSKVFSGHYDGLQMSNFSLTDYSRNHEFLEKVGNAKAVEQLKTLWVNVDRSARQRRVKKGQTKSQKNDPTPTRKKGMPTRHI